MNLEKFWVAAGAVQSINKDDHYVIMALPNGTEVAVENMIAGETERWIWYEPIDMPITFLIKLMEQWSGKEGYDSTFYACGVNRENRSPTYRIEWFEPDIRVEAYPLKKAIILALCQRFGVEV